MQLDTPRLRLTPLEPDDAGEMFPLLSDPAIYRYLDNGPPPTVEHLRAVYERQSAGRSPDGTQRWFNWIVRSAGNEPLGYVQATVVSASTAYVACVLAPRHWGRGYASESLRAMIRHLHETWRVATFLATVEALNLASIELLLRTGFSEARAGDVPAADLASTERLYILRRAPSAP